MKIGKHLEYGSCNLFNWQRIQSIMCFLHFALWQGHCWLDSTLATSSLKWVVFCYIIKCYESH